MAVPHGNDKRCVICHEDCSSKPRTKDARGRYYCKACYEQAAERQRHQPSQPEDVGLRLESLIPSRETATPCPSCGRSMNAGAVLCTNCGYNTQTGFRSTPPSSLQSAIKSSAPWFMSPVYLYIRPATFFRNFVNASPALTALFAWLFGMAGVIDRIDTRMASAQFSGRSSPLPDQWSIHWAIILGAGIFAGALYYSIGGWWYRVRVGWCGAKDTDRKLVRRVYILASLVFALPVILLKLFDTLRYKTPTAAAAGDFGIFELLVLVCLFWSIWNSYVGVRTVFETRRLLTMIWFLFMPALVYVIAVAGVLIAVFFMSSAPADTSHPSTFRSNGMVFMYPGNWTIDTVDPVHDPDGHVSVEPIFQDAILTIMIYETETSVAEELDSSIEGYRGWFAGARDTAPFSQWGQYSGQGRSLHGPMEGQEFQVRVFVTLLPDGRVLEVHETCSVDDLAEVEPGFQQVRSTFFPR